MNLGILPPLVVMPAVVGGHPSPFGHTCVPVEGIHLVAVIPAVSGGDPSERNTNLDSR